MLVIAWGNCQICNDSLSSFTLQEVSVSCKRCGFELEVCEDCKEKGCPKCKGKLVSAMEIAEEKGIIF